MQYLVLNVDGVEVPVIIGKGLSPDDVQFSKGKIVAAGVALVQDMRITCQGTMTVSGKEYVSRGLKDEVLLRSSDHM